MGLFDAFKKKPAPAPPVLDEPAGYAFVWTDPTGERVGALVDGIDGDVDGGESAVAHLLTVVEHRRFVLLAFADDDDAVEIGPGQHLAHRVDGRLVDGLLVAASLLARRRDRLPGVRHFLDRHGFACRHDKQRGKHDAAEEYCCMGCEHCYSCHQ